MTYLISLINSITQALMCYCWKHLARRAQTDSMHVSLLSLGVTKVPWLTSVAASFWTLWLARNERVLNDKIAKVKDLIFYAKMRTLLWLKASKEHVLIRGDLWCDDISCYSKYCSNNVVSSGWIPPEHGTVKFNMDGAVSGYIAGCGGVLRTDSEDLRAISLELVEGVEAGFSELMAVITVLDIFIEVEWVNKPELLVESDSYVV
ncbi:hypothetical protein F3Y22_tig00110114pilonHSYRG00627 [Hibiscus syriacus]|uniref:RNase H type-1 domain-containing protein n=1 Tax=Hibiscus syriacus TaxID=106335 RepID=A0A6A3BMM1_HIBSY|nr:hypothetical protein F3Y22_tig00110114pilonHSYRG00627 [Hibiscus syriacus]